MENSEASFWGVIIMAIICYIFLTHKSIKEKYVSLLQSLQINDMIKGEIGRVM